MVNVLIFRVDKDIGVSSRVLASFVDPGIERRHVNVFDLFSQSSLGSVVQLDSIGATAKEGMPGLEWFDEFQGIEELTECVVGLDV